MRLFYFINGLLADPAEHVRAWHERAERWVESKGKGVAGHHGYSMLPGEHWKLPEVVEGLHAVLKEREEWDRSDESFKYRELHLVGHSMGARVLCELLLKHPDISCAHLHLIAGACDARFDRNGLNQILDRSAREQIGQITCYISDSDRALKLAWYTRWLPFLGYGSMGLKRYRDMGKELASRKMNAAAAMITEVVDCSPLEHSEYFEEPHFDYLMQSITAGAI